MVKFFGIDYICLSYLLIEIEDVSNFRKEYCPNNKNPEVTQILKTAMEIARKEVDDYFYEPEKSIEDALTVDYLNAIACYQSIRFLSKYM